MTQKTNNLPIIGDIIPDRDGIRNIGRVNLRIGKLHVREIIADVVSDGGGSIATRQVFAGEGLTGGGYLSSDITLNIGEGDGIDVSTNAVSVNSTVVRTSRTITAGLGLSGGGTLASDLTLTVNTGNGIHINSDNVAVNLSATSGLEFNTSQLQIADSIAGNGLSISSKILAVNVGTGLAISSDTVIHDTGLFGDLHQNYAELAVNETITGNWIHSGTTTFNGNVSGTGTINMTANGANSLTNRLGINNTPDATLDLKTYNTAKNVITIQAITSQTSHFMEMKNVGGTTLGYFDVSGRLRTPRIAVDGAINANAGVYINSNSGGLTDGDIRIEYNGSNWAKMNVTSGGNLVLETTGSIILNPEGTNHEVNPFQTYETNLGRIDNKYLTLFAAELWVETLVAQETIATIGGRILVAPTTHITRKFLSGDGTIYLKHNQPRNGDIMYLEARGFVEFIQITSSYTLQGAGDYAYTVTRNLDGTGANDWEAGAAVLNTGGAGNGFIDLYSLYGVNGRLLDYIFVGGTGSNMRAERNFALFGAIPSSGTTTYFGLQNTLYANLFFNITQAFVGTGKGISWQYWNGSTWTNLGSVVATPDSTFNTTGFYSIAFPSAQASWTTTTVNGVSAFWIRATLTYSGITTAPIQGKDFVFFQKRQYGPSIVFNVRNSTTYNDWTENVVLGNLNGNYGYGNDTYGFAAGKYSASTSWVSADATNGFRVMRGDTQISQWDISGNMRIGRTGTSEKNVYITTGGSITINDNTTPLITIDSTPTILIGRETTSQSSIRLTAGGLQIRNNSVTKLEMDNAGNLTLQGNLTVSTGNIIAGTTTTGTIMNNSGITGVASSVNQVTISSSTGKLSAGAGKVLIDADGIRLLSANSMSYSSPSAFKIYNSANNVLYSSWSTQNDVGTVVNELAAYSQAAISTSMNISAYSTHTNGEVFANLSAVDGTDTAFISVYANGTGSTRISMTSDTFSINTSGSITKSLPIGAFVYHNTTQTLNNNATTTLAFNSESADVGGMHSTSLNTGRIVVQTDGFYSIGCNIRTDAFTADGTIRLAVRWTESGGGLTESIAESFSQVNNTRIPSLSACNSYFYAEAGDYFDFSVTLQNAGGNRTLQASAPMSNSSAWAYKIV